MYYSWNSPTDQLVRKFKDSVVVKKTMKTFFTFRTLIFSYPYSNTSMKWGLRRVVPAAVVTTHARPHAQEQLPRDLEYIFIHIYKVPLREAARGVAQERNEKHPA